jgi:hypothetical protein
MFGEDALVAPLDHVMMWPQGFYRNHTTKSDQLLLRSAEHRMAVVIDDISGAVNYTFLLNDGQIGTLQINRWCLKGHLTEPTWYTPVMAHSLWLMHTVITQLAAEMREMQVIRLAQAVQKPEAAATS